MKPIGNRPLVAAFTCIVVVALLAGCLPSGPAATPDSGLPLVLADVPWDSAHMLQAQGAQGVPIGPTAVYSGLMPEGIARGLRTPFGKPTATPAPGAPTAPANVVFSDDFSDPYQGGWKTGRTSAGTIAIAGGKMTITVTQGGYTVGTTRKDANASDFVIDVDTTQGPKGELLGIIARVSDNPDGTSNFYAFTIMGQGYMAYVRQGDSASALAGPNSSSAIKTGPGAVNHLRLVAEGGDLTFYVNATKVATAHDETLSEGSYGLIVAGQNAGASASFDNFVLSAPGAQAATPAPATPGPHATRTPKPAADVIFSDDFSSKTKGGWTTKTGSSYSATIAGGQLSIQIKKPQWLAWVNNGQTADDYMLDVDTQYADGESDGEYGVILRLAPSGRDDVQFYIFGITPAGVYYFALYDAGDWTMLVDATFSDAINTELGDVNHVRVVAKGDTFTLFINGEQVDEVTDDTITEGLYALYAGAGDSGDMTAAFDNFVLTAAP